MANKQYGPSLLESRRNASRGSGSVVASTKYTHIHKWFYEVDFGTGVSMVFGSKSPLQHVDPSKVVG